MPLGPFFVAALAACLVLTGCDQLFLTAGGKKGEPKFPWTVVNQSAVAANAATHGKYWYSVASNSDGTKLLAGDGGPSTSNIADHQGDLWRSTDGGATWTDLASLSGNSATAARWWQAVASSADGTKLVAVVNAGDIWVSADSGASWTDVSQLAGNETIVGGWFNSVASSADGATLAVTSWYGSVWMSHDSGATWTNLCDVVTSNLVAPTNWQSIAMSADGTKLAVACVGDLWTSSDSGQTWTKITATQATGMSWSRVTLSDDGTRLAAVNDTDGRIWISSDSGATLTQVSASAGVSPSSWRALTASGDGQTLAAADSAGCVAFSFDAGAHWKQAQLFPAPNGDEAPAYAPNLTTNPEGKKFAYVQFGGDLWTWTLP